MFIGWSVTAAPVSIHPTAPSTSTTPRFTKRLHHRLNVRRIPTALLALVACSLAACPAAAAPPERLRLSSNSSCPSAEDVVAELAPLLPHTRVEATSPEASDGD